MPSYYYRNYSRKKKKSKFHRFVIYTLVLLLFAAIGIGYLMYKVIYCPNVWINDGEKISIYIPDSANFEQVSTILYSNGLIVNRKNFEWLSRKKHYPELIKPGHYIILNGMTNDELVNMLRAGEQIPINVIFNNINTKEQLAKRIAKQLELDSLSLITLMNDSLYLKQFGFTPDDIKIMFIPNTYEFYWATGAKAFMNRMYKEYKNFWDKERIALTDSIGMSINEVVTLASIVQKETNKNDEKPIIAGAYKNRLRRGWRLQADPTLVFALGDFNIKRVLNIHKEIDSPYNTYKYGGLPPGPICIPSISSIDAVLNYDRNDYLFFCAKEDMSGYHNFAKTNSQHSLNARKYQQALNKLKIYK
jgi:peptidoglycan lytic transglycosylase G